VWNVYIDPSTFERRWNRLIEQYGLREHGWLSEMYHRRDEWIPAFFRDIPMCCLMKTTSRCESSNHLFKTNSSSFNTLVQFMLCFDTSLDGQRNQQRLLHHTTETTLPKFKTSLAIERHANDIYTRTIFFEVQKEIYKSLIFCYIAGESKLNGSVSYMIAHQDHRKEIVNKFMVCVF